MTDRTTQELWAYRVIKKFPKGVRGSKQISARFGADLVCVRHRVDPTGTRRFTTVELVVAETAIQRRPSPLVDVFVKVQERDLQARIKAAGGRWDKQEGVWRIRRATAVALGLRSRILPRSLNP
jgi:hypothetical protein